MSVQTATPQAMSTDLTGTYVIDPTHSRIGFVARHAMITKVRGQFNEYSGSAIIDSDNLESSSAEVEIQVESIDTRNDQRDAHLRTNDFFDVPNHPTITFRSKSVERTGPDTATVSGELTIKGVTKSVEIEFEHTGIARDPYGNLRAGFEGKTTINRRDWGVEWNTTLETGGVLVSEKITLEFEISAIRTGSLQ